MDLEKLKETIRSQRDKVAELESIYRKLSGGEDALPKAKSVLSYQERERIRRAQLSRDKVASGQEIGEPQITEEQRKIGADLRAECERDLVTFAVKAFPESTGLKPLGSVQIDSLGHDQNAILHGGRVNKLEPRGFGKCQELNTRIPTPSGWSTIGDLQVGDTVYDDQGKPCNVTFVTPVKYNCECFEIEFSDGEKIIADADHRWKVYDRFYRKGKDPKVLTTKEMVGREVLTTKRGYTERRYRVDLAKPIYGEYRRMLIDPYVLGAWLGDGSSRFATIHLNELDYEHFKSQFEYAGEPLGAPHKTQRVDYHCVACTINPGGQIYDSETIQHQRSSFRKNHEKFGIQTAIAVSKHTKRFNRGQGFTSKLRELELIKNKHIPAVYLRASVTQRLSLLQGLMDTDGTISKNGEQCEITTKWKHLADQIIELISSLGLKATISEKEVKGKIYQRINFHATRETPVFRLPRHLLRMKRTRSRRMHGKQIVSIKPVPSVPVKCIEVDSPSHLYLCGERFTITHNTTRSAVAALWGTLYGHVRFVPIFCSAKQRADEIIDGWQTELLTNDYLFWMFPDLMWPFRALEGSYHKSHGQRFRGKRTNLKWTKSLIIYPTVEGEKGSGSLLAAKPWRNARGTQYRTEDGEVLRPSMCILDDIQRDEDAASPMTVDKILRTIRKSILRLGGRNRTLTVINNATPIEPNDVAEQLADDPAWSTVRYKMLMQRATKEDIWLGEYASIRQTYIKGDKDDQMRARMEASQFYLDHREEMDEGAEVSWEWAYAWADEPQTEFSSIQAAYNILIDDGEEAFECECQCAPMVNLEEHVQAINYEALAKKQTQLPMGKVPLCANRLICHVDVQGPLLFVGIGAVADDFEGSMIWWGSFPQQPRHRYTLTQVTPTIQDLYKGKPSAQLYQALIDCFRWLANWEFEREDGTAMRLSRIGVDARWQTRSVRKACRDSEFASIVMPVMGEGVRTKERPISVRPVKEGETRGVEWVVRKSETGQLQMMYDTNFWKSTIQQLIFAPPGDAGSWTVCKAPEGAMQQLSDHFEAEMPKRLTYRDRTSDEWELRPRVTRNDHFDNFVAIAAMASQLGAKLPEHERPKIGTGKDKIYVRKPIDPKPGGKIFRKKQSRRSA